ncbi:MAG: YetF domain-containing protein [Ferruginibacter sp.]
MVIAIRIFGKKELAQLSVIDLVFILLISNSVQNAMVGPDTSLSGGIIAATALFITNFILKRVLYKSKKVTDFIEGKAILLIYRGIIQQHNLDHAEITLEELEAAVREHGVKDIQQVDLAMLEADGNISIISDDFQKQSVRPMSAMGHRRKHKLRGRIGQN